MVRNEKQLLTITRTPIHLNPVIWDVLHNLYSTLVCGAKIESLFGWNLLEGIFDVDTAPSVGSLGK